MVCFHQCTLTLLNVFDMTLYKSFLVQTNTQVHVLHHAISVSHQTQLDEIDLILYHYQFTYLIICHN